MANYDELFRRRPSQDPDNRADQSEPSFDTFPELRRLAEQATAGRGLPADQRDRLTRTIEGEVIPRLMLTHGSGCLQPRAEDYRRALIDDSDVETLTRLILSNDPDEAEAFLATLHDRGVPLESLFLDVIAPTARLLGTLWEQDEVTFADVSVSLSRLQRLLRRLGPTFEREYDYHPSGLRVLLLPAPGEQHTLGLIMLEEFLRRGGHDVVKAGDADGAEALAIVLDQPFDVIGVSASCDDRLDILRQHIATLRRSARVQPMAIMVGGKAFLGYPDRVRDVGADSTATDGRQAAHYLKMLLDKKSASLSRHPRYGGLRRSNVYTGSAGKGEPIPIPEDFAARS